MIDGLFVDNQWFPDEGVRMGHTPYARCIYLGFDSEVCLSLHTSMNIIWSISFVVTLVDLRMHIKI